MSMNYGARDSTKRRNPGARKKGLGLSGEGSHSLLFPGGRRSPILSHPQVSIGPFGSGQPSTPSLVCSGQRLASNRPMMGGIVCMKQLKGQVLTDSPLETKCRQTFGIWGPIFWLGPFCIPSRKTMQNDTPPHTIRQGVITGATFSYISFT